MGTEPITGADVREELEAMGIEDPAERSLVRRLVAFLEDGYHRERVPKDKADKAKEKRQQGQDALAHYRSQARGRPPSGQDLAALRR